MHYLKGFSPFIAAALAGALFDWRIAGLAGFITACVLVFAERRGGRQWDSMVLELVALSYFGAQTVFACAFPTSSVETYTGFISMGWLAAAAWGSLLYGKPFTIALARAGTSPDMWEHPIFLRANVVISTVWAASSPSVRRPGPCSSSPLPA